MSRVAIVTGASGGIGGAVARALAADGTAVACWYRTGRDAAERVVADVERTGGSARAFEGDVADEASVGRAIDAVETWAGPADIVVNAAGVVRDGLALRYPVEDLRTLLDVHVTGSFLVSRAALRHMLRQRWGRVVNVASVVGLKGNAGQSAYSASKAGVIGMTRSLATEVGGRGITVNAVCPGLIETEMTAALPARAVDRMIAATPAGRCGRPEEVASVVRFLATEEASFVNGAVVPVDGGMSA